MLPEGKVILVICRPANLEIQRVCQFRRAFIIFDVLFANFVPKNDVNNAILDGYI